MKKVTIIIIAFLLAFSAYAQEATDIPLSTSTKKPIHTLAVSVGPAWITSRIYTPYYSYKWRTGFEMTAEYHCVFKNNLGFGITYSHNHTGYPYDAKMNLNYIGPSFVIAENLSEKLRGKLDVGLGYANCSDGFTNQNGLGYKTSTELEYVLSDKIGIAVQLMSITTRLGKQDSYYPGNKDDINGVERFGLSTGMRIHI